MDFSLATTASSWYLGRTPENAFARELAKDVEAEAVAVTVEAGVDVEKGLLRSLKQAQSESKRENLKAEVEVLELESTGDYLAFLEEGDAVYVPREIMEWMEARQEPESFLKRLARQFKKT